MSVPSKLCVQMDCALTIFTFCVAHYFLMGVWLSQASSPSLSSFHLSSHCMLENFKCRTMSAHEAVDVYGSSCGAMLCCAPHQSWFDELRLAVERFLDFPGGRVVVLVMNMFSCLQAAVEAFSHRVLYSCFLPSSMTLNDFCIALA